MGSLTYCLFRLKLFLLTFTSNNFIEYSEQHIDLSYRFTLYGLPQHYTIFAVADWNNKYYLIIFTEKTVMFSPSQLTA